MQPDEVLSRDLKDSWTISSVLSRQAAERPESPALQWQTEEPLTYRGLYEHCLRLAGGLRGLGVEPGDRVLIMLPNSMEIVLAWFGVNLLGAVEVPINIHYKESWLVHEVNDCEARLAVVHLVDEPALLEVDVYGDLDGPQQVDAEPRQYDLHAVRQHDKDPVAGLDAQPTQPPGEAQAVFVEPPVS